MTHYWFCGVCASNIVPRPGATCGLCKGTIDALTDPITLTPTTKAAPLGVRILRWIHGRNVA